MPNFNDASSLVFVRGQTTTIEREVQRTTFPEIIYPQYIPVTTTGSPFASSVTFVSTDQAGVAGWINGNADDVPMADAALNAEVKPVHTAGIGYGYGWQEVNEAQLLGTNLRSDKALAARRAYEQMIDRIAFAGDATVNMTGLIEGAGSTQEVTTGTFDWATGAVDAQTIVSDLVLLINATGEGNSYTANTIVLPEAEYTYAATTFFSNGSQTALDYMAARYPGLRITGLNALADGGGASVNRYIAYARSPDVLTLHIPMPHRFLPVYQAGPLRYEVPGVFRVGGVNIKRPEDVAFADGA